MCVNMMDPYQLARGSFRVFTANCHGIMHKGIPTCHMHVCWLDAARWATIERSCAEEERKLGERGVCIQSHGIKFKSFLPCNQENPNPRAQTVRDINRTRGFH